MKKASITRDSDGTDYTIIAALIGLPALIAGLAAGMATNSTLVGVGVGVFMLGTYGTAIAIPALRKN